MPAIVDTHTHMPTERDLLVDHLHRQAYWGVGAVASLGLDDVALALDVRANPVPGAARLLTAGRGITTPEPGRSVVPSWVTTPDEARAAAADLAKNRVDIIKIWVDDRNGQYKKMTPDLWTPVIEEAHPWDAAPHGAASDPTSEASPANEVSPTREARPTSGEAASPWALKLPLALPIEQ